MAVSITVQQTPNPNARRFLLSHPVQETSRGRFFTADADVQEEPLVGDLLAIDGVEGVLLLPSSVTVNKDNNASWEDVEPSVRDALERHFV